MTTEISSSEIISCLTLGYYIFSGCNKSQYGRHRTSQWRNQKKNIFSFIVLLNDFAQSCSRKMWGVGGKKENDHYGLPPAGSSRVNQMCIPYLCRSKAYSVRYNVHMKWGWQRKMLIIIGSWSLLVTFTNLLFFSSLSFLSLFLSVLDRIWLVIKLSHGLCVSSGSFR